MADEAFTSFSASSSGLRPGPIAARIGQEVRSWRQEAGVSEEDLASALLLSGDAIRSAESGDPCFTAEQIVTICQKFAVRPSRFMENLL